MVGNPLNEHRKAEIERITKHVLEEFLKAYLSAYKDVMVEEAEKKRAPPKQKPVDPEQGDVPPRPRKDMEPPPPAGVLASIISWEELDYDVDPYICYVIKASLGDEEAQVYRRYNEFKVLHKKVGKKVKSAKLPAPSSKFGKRNLDRDFIWKRKKHLGEYLQLLLNDPDAKKNEFFIKDFLALDRKEDPLMRKTFDLAFERLKWRLWIWKKIAADKDADKIAKVVIEEIKRELFYDIRAELHDLPHKMQKMTMQVVYKGISATVGPAVAAAWTAAQKAVEEIKPKVDEIVLQALDPVIACRNALKEKIKEVMQKAMDPVMEQLLPVIEDLVRGLAGPIGDATMPFVNKMTGEWRDKYKAVLYEDKWEKEKFHDLKKEVKDFRKEIEKAVEAKLKEALEALLGDLKKKISLEALASVFSPFEKVYDIFKEVFKMFSPKVHEEVLKEFMDAKEELLKIGGGDVGKVNELLDREEQNVMWRRWWSTYHIRRKGYNIYWNVWSLLDNYNIAREWYDFTYECADLNDDLIHKFSWKFGDYLNDECAKGAAGDMKATMNKCIDIGWDRAVALVYRRMAVQLKALLKRFFMAAVVGDIVKHVEPLLKEAVDPLQDLIIAPADQLLDLKVMVSQCFRQVISENLDKVVETCSATCYKAFGGQ